MNTSDQKQNSNQHTGLEDQAIVNSASTSASAQSGRTSADSSAGESGAKEQAKAGLADLTDRGHQSEKSTLIQPALFLGHGTPMNALETNSFTQTWKDMGLAVKSKAKPRAILAVSAHWYTRGSAVTISRTPETIHDFYGFPQELFNVEYPALGDPEIAQRVIDIAKPKHVIADNEWGLDHGTWSLLVHMFPEADIPVIQLSVDAQAPIEEHIALGAKLNQLRHEGVLILGSGNVVHNLRAVDFHAGNTGYDWADRFDADIAEIMLNSPEMLSGVVGSSDYAKAAPTPDHFLPLAYVAGIAAESGEQLEISNYERTLKSLSMTSYSTPMGLGI